MEKSHVGMSICFWCQQPKVILLDKRLRKTLSKNMIVDYEPCEACKKTMAEGILLVEVEATGVEGQYELKDGWYPTGRWAVANEAPFLDCIADEQIKEAITKTRRCLLEPVQYEHFVGGQDEDASR